MPDTAPAPDSAATDDFSAMISELDAPSDAPLSAPPGHATTMEAFQAPAPAPAPAPIAEPTPAPAPEASEATPTPPTAPEAQEPAPFDPTKELDPNQAKNWRVAEGVRVTAQNAVEQTAFAIRRAAQAEGRAMSLGEAEQEAYRQLGLIVPSPAAAPTAPTEPTQAPTAPANPLTELNSRLAAIKAELKDTNPVLDAERYHELLDQKDELMNERAELRVQQALQEREEIAVQASAVDQQFKAVSETFEDLQDPQSPFYQKFAELHNRNVLADSPALEEPDYEQSLAAQVAGMLLLQGKPFRMKGAATLPAGSPTPTGTPPAAPAPAAPTTRTAPPAGMAAIPANHATATREHRVTIQQADPTQAHQQALQSALAGGDMDTVLSALEADLGGREAPGLKIYSIE